MEHELYWNSSVSHLQHSRRMSHTKWHQSMYTDTIVSDHQGDPLASHNENELN